MWLFYRPRPLKYKSPLFFFLMRPMCSGAAVPVPCCKFGQVQAQHRDVQSAHLQKANPKSLFPPFPSSAFRSRGFHVFFFCSHKGYPSCAPTSAGLNGLKCVNRCVFVTRFSQVPGLTLFVSLAPGASFLFSPRPPPPQPASSLPDAPLSLQGPADCLPAATGS